MAVCPAAVSGVQAHFGSVSAIQEKPPPYDPPVVTTRFGLTATLRPVTGLNLLAAPTVWQARCWKSLISKRRESSSVWPVEPSPFPFTNPRAV